MKTKEPITLTHVISEPGDATRYDYAYWVDDTVFRFVAIESEFCFPLAISLWASEEDIPRLADKYDCNPHTVRECLRTIKEHQPAEGEM